MKNTVLTLSAILISFLMIGCAPNSPSNGMADGSTDGTTDGSTDGTTDGSTDGTPNDAKIEEGNNDIERFNVLVKSLNEKGIFVLAETTGNSVPNLSEENLKIARAELNEVIQRGTAAIRISELPGVVWGEAATVRRAIQNATTYLKMLPAQGSAGNPYTVREAQAKIAADQEAAKRFVEYSAERAVVVVDLILMNIVEAPTAETTSAIAKSNAGSLLKARDATAALVAQGEALLSNLNRSKARMPLSKFADAYEKAFIPALSEIIGNLRANLKLMNAELNKKGSI